MSKKGRSYIFGTITYSLTGKLLCDIQLGNNIRMKNENIHMTYRKKRGLLQWGTRKQQLTWAMAFFLEFNVFISCLLSSTLEEIHSPKKVLLNERGLKINKNKHEMILPLSSQCANLEWHFPHFTSPTPRPHTHIHKRSEKRWTNPNLTQSKEGIQLWIQERLGLGSLAGGI